MYTIFINLRLISIKPMWFNISVIVSDIANNCLNDTITAMTITTKHPSTSPSKPYSKHMNLVVWSDKYYKAVQRLNLNS